MKIWVLICLVWFLFDGPSTHFRSFRMRSITLSTLFLGKTPGNLPVLSANSFARNWQLLFLNQRKKENGCRNFFMTKSPWKHMPDIGIKLRAAWQAILSFSHFFCYFNCNFKSKFQSLNTSQIPRMSIYTLYMYRLTLFTQTLCRFMHGVYVHKSTCVL